MLRIIIRETDIGAAAHLGAPVRTNLKTFDTSLPEVEAYLRGSGEEADRWVTREVIGVSLVPPATECHAGRMTADPCQPGVDRFTKGASVL